MPITQEVLGRLHVTVLEVLEVDDMEVEVLEVEVVVLEVEVEVELEVDEAHLWPAWRQTAPIACM